MKDTFTSAFPRSNEVNEYGTVTMYADPGMQLRDYFAAKALIALVSVCESDTLNGKTYHEHCAEHAYKMADAMMLERLK